MVIGSIAVVALIVAGVFIWNQVQALMPNAIYRNAKSSDESRRAAQESQRKYQTPMNRFQRMKMKQPGPSAAGAPAGNP